jgi:hypothetical protein
MSLRAARRWWRSPSWKPEPLQKEPFWDDRGIELMNELAGRPQKHTIADHDGWVTKGLASQHLMSVVVAVVAG